MYQHICFIAGNDEQQCVVGTTSWSLGPNFAISLNLDEGTPAFRIAINESITGGVVIQVSHQGVWFEAYRTNRSLKSIEWLHAVEELWLRWAIANDKQARGIKWSD